MFHQVNRFVSHFRQLEKQQFTLTKEEEKRWKSLKEKLAASPPADEQPYIPVFRSYIAVVSLYPQAGASFVASNFAYVQAGKGIPTTLCEMPGDVSYFYFALDYERRAHHNLKDSTGKVLLLQNNLLRIKVDASLHKQSHSQTDIVDWFFSASKETPCLIIDLSSRWRGDLARRILDLADEIWVVFDSDLARLTRLCLVEEPPAWWNQLCKKIRLIANRWNSRLLRHTILKRVEGTLSLWNHDHFLRNIDVTIPQIDGEKVADAHSKASILSEIYPEDERWFDVPVLAGKGRMS
jgi:hypothetical protein